jgi:CRISPR system Cascade subunit CasD
MTIALLRFEAPMMSFGSPRIDAYERAGFFPTPSMVTGLFGAALGVPRRRHQILQEMQDSMQVGAAIERQGRVVDDYQTVDLGKPFLTGPMWTVEGVPVERAGSGIDTTRQQWRQYIGDGVVIATVHLGPGFPFDPQDLGEAMLQPAHPLFIGRSSCPPAGQIWQGLHDGSMLEVLQRKAPQAIEYMVPVPDYVPEIGDLLMTVNGRKKWSTDKHLGAQVYLRRAS